VCGIAGVVKDRPITRNVLDRLRTAGSVTYAYDDLDRILSRGPSGAFVYGGFESDPVSDGTEQFLRTPSGRLAGLKRGASVLLTGADRHGDVSWTLNPSTGVVADSVIRDPFGKVLGSSGSVPRIGFQGDWTDPTNGLVWMAARWYQPLTGTFLSRDTYPGEVGAAVSLNRFSYGLNDPLRYFDPTGHTAQTKTNAELWDEYQRTGNVASDQTYYENEDGSYNSGVYVNTVIDEYGNEVVQSVVSPTGVVTVSASGTVNRSSGPLGFTPNQQHADTVRELTDLGASANDIADEFRPRPSYSSQDFSSPFTISTAVGGDMIPYDPLSESTVKNKKFRCIRAYCLTGPLDPGPQIVKMYRGDLARMGKIFGLDPRLLATILLHENDYSTTAQWNAKHLAEIAYAKAFKYSPFSTPDGNEGHVGLFNLKYFGMVGLLDQLREKPGGDAMVKAIQSAYGTPGKDPDPVDLFVASATNGLLSIALKAGRMRLAQDYTVEQEAEGRGNTINGIEVTTAEHILYDSFVGAENANLETITSQQYQKHDPEGAIASIRKYYKQANKIMCGKDGKSCK
jgi:RHS repeat-associated protein